MWLLSSIVDTFGEITGSMSRNKLRVGLTGFSVAFGIFMLMILLAAGNGLRNGVASNFRGQSNNTMMMWGGWTSLEWNGHQKGRRINLNANHLQAVENRHSNDIDHISYTIERSVTANVGRNNRTLKLNGVGIACRDEEGLQMVAGRWLNHFDMNDGRRVAVLDVRTLDVLFPRQAYERCIGQWVCLGGLNYQLVGCYRLLDAFRNDEMAFVPYTTMATIYSGAEQELSGVRISLRGLDTRQDIEDFEQRLRRTMAEVEDFSPDDPRGVWIWNTAEDYLKFMNMMNALRLFIWIIGIASLMAGIVGISNIMMITVKERTREFGIRKAIGARPRSIIGMVLLESVTITLMFGYIGMLAGVGLMQLVNSMLQSGASTTGRGPTVFLNPSIDFNIAIAATLIMVVAGLVAGYIPTRQAVKIKPVEALAAT